MPSGCWEWTGYCDRFGYGRTASHPPLGAHRVAYEQANGPIPKGMMICHRCDNPPCCNPAHLFAGTTRDNALDMLRKGRARNQHGGQNQTHCINGHEFTPDNTYWRPGKVASRDCRACGRIRQQRSVARRALADA